MSEIADHSDKLPSSADRPESRHAHFMRIAAVVGAMLGILLVALGHAAWAIPLAVLLVATQVPAPSVARSVMLAAPIMMGSTAVVMTACAAAGMRLNLTMLLLAYLMAPGALAALCGTADRSSVISATDGPALAAASAVFVAFYRPFLSASSGEKVALLSWSTDQATHLHLIAAVLQAGGYINFLPDGNGVRPFMQDYPGGWAGHVAFVLHAFVGPSPSPQDLLAGGVVAVGLTYACFTYFCVLLALVVAGKTATCTTLPTVVCTSFLTVFAIFGPAATSLHLGSYTLVAATTCILAALVLIAEMTVSKRRLTACVCLLGIAGMQSWYLLAPIILAVSLHYLVKGGLTTKHVATAGILTAPFLFYPVYTGPRASHVGQPGPTVLPDVWTLSGMLLLVLAVTVWLLLPSRPHFADRMVLALPIVTSLFLFVGLILVQEWVGTGANYYAVKVLTVTFVLAAIATAASFCATLSAPSLVPRPRGLLLLTVCVLTVLTGTNASTQATSHFVGTSRGDIDAAVFDAIFEGSPNVELGHETWVLDRCTDSADYIMSKWWHDLSLTYTSALNQAYYDTLIAQIDDATPLLKHLEDPAVKSLTVYVSVEVCSPNYVDALSQNSKVRVIRI